MTDFRCYICSEGEDEPVPATHPGCEHLGADYHVEGVTWGLCDECHAAGQCPECAEAAASKRMTSKQAREWIAAQDESSTIDDDELDAALIALGYDPDYLRGDADDPTDRRWDTACAEVADAQAQDDGEEQA